MRDWIETWQLEVHLVNLTAAWGAINVAGPRARDLLGPVLSDDALDGQSFPTCATASSRSPASLPRHPPGVRRRALRSSSTTAAPRASSLWDALLEAGSDRDPPPRAGGAAAPAAREGPRHRRPGHRLRLDPREAQHVLGGQARQADLRGQGGAPASGGVRAGAQAGGSALRQATRLLRGRRCGPVASTSAI